MKRVFKKCLRIDNNSFSRNFNSRFQNRFLQRYFQSMPVDRSYCVRNKKVNIPQQRQIACRRTNSQEIPVTIIGISNKCLRPGSGRRWRLCVSTGTKLRLTQPARIDTSRVTNYGTLLTSESQQFSIRSFLCTHYRSYLTF